MRRSSGTSPDAQIEELANVASLGCAVVLVLGPVLALFGPLAYAAELARSFGRRDLADRIETRMERIAVRVGLLPADRE